jgi:hypothetical protein
MRYARPVIFRNDISTFAYVVVFPWDMFCNKFDGLPKFYRLFSKEPMCTFMPRKPDDTTPGVDERRSVSAETEGRSDNVTRVSPP